MATQGQRRFAALALALLPGLMAAACGDSDGDDQGSGLRAAFVPGPAPPAVEAAFLQLFKASGELVTLDVVGTDISAPLDGLDLVVSFDPLVVEAFGVSDKTFLGECGQTRPDNTVLLCLDNIANGGAAATGELFFSARPQGSNPTPESVSSGRVLASITFRALRKGRSPVAFHVASSPGSTGGFSQVTSAVDPTGAAMVAFSPAVPDRALIRVTRR